MKKVGTVFIFLVVFLTYASASAAPKQTVFSDKVISGFTQIYPLTNHSIVLADQSHNILWAVDSDSRELLWSKPYTTPIYDCYVLTNPVKIVVMTQENNSPKKMVLSQDGTVLSQQTFKNIKMDGAQDISWSPAKDGGKERLILSSNDQISLYQYPWKKASSSIPFKVTKDNEFESTRVDDIQTHFPYAVVKLSGSSLVQTQDMYRIIDVTTKKKIALTADWNVNTNFVVEGKELVMYTSGIMGVPGGIDPGRNYTMYTRYDLKTGAQVAKLTRSFSNSEASWRTSYIQSRLFLSDTDNPETFAMYDQDGKLVLEVQTTANTMKSQPIGYNNSQLFLLTPAGEGKAQVTAVDLN